MVKIDLFSISHDNWCIHVHVYILKVGWNEYKNTIFSIMSHMYYIGECANHQSDDNIQKTCTDVHLFL